MTDTDSKIKILEAILEARQRCFRANSDLFDLSEKTSDIGEKKRIIGKIEGVKLARDYFIECLENGDLGLKDDMGDYSIE